MITGLGWPAKSRIGVSLVNRQIKSLSILTAIAAGAALALASPIVARPAQQALGQLLTGQRYDAIPMRRLASNHQVVSVSVNGRQALFLVDSGAAGTVIDRNQLGRFGIGGSLREGSGIGAGGAIRVSLHRLDSFRIGGQSVPLGQIVSTDLSGVIAGLRAGDVAGVLGQDVLTRHSGVIDVRGGILYLKLR